VVENVALRKYSILWIRGRNVG